MAPGARQPVDVPLLTLMNKAYHDKAYHNKAYHNNANHDRW
jgi:hypothetical protein